MTVAVTGRGRAWLLWQQMPRSFRIGAVILALHLMVAVTGPFWAPFGYSEMGAGPPLSGEARLKTGSALTA